MQKKHWVKFNTSPFSKLGTEGNLLNLIKDIYKKHNS